MSRGIKDLRELICVSRLSLRHSDDESCPSDEGDGNSLHSNSSESRNSSATSASRLKFQKSRSFELQDPQRPRSSDSGVGSNGISPESFFTNSPSKNKEQSSELFKPRAPLKNSPSDKPKYVRAKQRSRRKKGVLELQPTRHELPGRVPLPPLQANSNQSSLTSSSCSDSETFSPKSDRKSKAVVSSFGRDGNFDELLTYIDGTIVSEWLVKGNSQVTDMAKWCHTGENFVQFAHFWMTDFPEIQKYEIFKLEHSIVLDQLSLSFAAGRDNGHVKHRDVTHFLQAVFKEYPNKLMTSKGPYIFLDHLEVLSSERTSSYKELLSDVKCCTKIKQNAQWILAIRSFALVSIWHAVISFYRRLLPPDHASENCALLSLTTIAKLEPNQQRMYQAIRNGFLDVINYLLVTHKVRANFKDSHNRTLIFTAVMHNQAKVLKHFVTKVKPCPDVNVAADTGNTPLHAASNNGFADVVHALLQFPDIQIDPKNSQCEDATPLLLAVMHGHTEVVEILLKAKADKNAKMGDLTALEIARDFGHEEIVKLFQDRGS